MQFQDLPLDIRSRILHEGSQYSISNIYDNHIWAILKKKDTMNPISSIEIANALNDPTYDNLIIYVLVIGNNSLFIDKFYVGGKRFTGQHVEIKNNGVVSSVSRPSSPNYKRSECDESGVVINRGYFGYYAILLPPNTLRIILSRRGSLCHKHINSVIRQYIDDVISEHTEHISYYYLMICAIDLKLDIDTIPGYVTNDGINYDVYLNDYTIEKFKDDLYERINERLI